MLMAKLNNTDSGLVLLTLSPDMGGIEIIDVIRKANAEYTIIVTYDPDDHDSDVLVQALEMGAYECAEVPEQIHGRGYKEFRLHLLTVIGLLRTRKRFSTRPVTAYKNKFFMPVKKEEKPYDEAVHEEKPLKEKRVLPKVSVGRFDIIAIASSTGGPEILSQIFSILPGNLKVPILLVQHIPKDMTRYFAKSLNEKSELNIFQASHGDEILPSNVYLAPGGQHMTVSAPDFQGKRQIYLNQNPPVNGVRPSADILFESIAKSYNGKILAVVLTGMGEDGKKGVAWMKKSGCVCITQTAQSCVVYGMPKAIDEAGLSDEQLDPLSITQKIVMAGQ